MVRRRSLRPKTTCPWHDCTSRVFSDAAVPAAPGVKLDCASYDADLDPVNGATGTLSIGVVRARLAADPARCGPAGLYHRLGPAVVAAAAGLAVPGRRRRPAQPPHRRRRPSRHGHRRARSTASISSTARRCTTRRSSRPATTRSPTSPTSCKTPPPVAPTPSRPATPPTITPTPPTDIERLRSIWDVPALALIGIGNGAQVALSYASSHPDRVARLALDSPVALGVGAEAAAEQRVKGQQAALDAFAAQCAAVNCPLGPDPKAAVSSLLADARSGHGPGGASVASVANAITTALGFPTGDRVGTTNDLATALANARSGDTNLLTSLINRAEATTGTDGQFVNTCSDALNRPTPDRIRELVVAWAKLYPQFGTVGALNLVKCVAWPSASPPTATEVLKLNVLLMGVQNDPIVGSEGVSATAALIINATAASKRVMWQGIGHGASIYSSCAVPPLIGYLNSGKLPSTDTYCPA